MAPNIELDSILLLGIIFYIRNIILLGLTTKKTITQLLLLRLPGPQLFLEDPSAGLGFLGLGLRF